MPILYGGEQGLIGMGWNMPAIFEGNCEFSLVGLGVPTLNWFVRK